ncbi:MAG: glutamine--fructose-6-phosphate transaminase (isomerizing) [Lachnospiraceae bacterium]|nr:glutamine--fructose-6-phosphate transaminase (isomerizing) [Lachnospiraceae bacterium]
MCGIVGIVGKRAAAPILLEGLSKLEYRGYDSAGIAVRDGDKKPVVVKAKGRLSVLSEKTDGGKSVKGSCGIGHTRWATHGEPSEINAHPHVSDDGNVIGIHNGIIENYQELRDKLIRHDYKFYSGTDSEVAVKLIDYYYKKYQIGPIDAIAKTMVRVRGSYALAVMFEDYPGEIYVARKDSPLVIGLGEGENFLGSDVPAILKYTDHVTYINDMEMARLTADGVEYYNLDGDKIEKEVVLIDWDAAAAEKGGYEHFMIKEIHEQPGVIRDTIGSGIKGEPGSRTVNLESFGLTAEQLKGVDNIVITACGSAYHVGMVAQYVIEDLTRVPVRVELASEFRYRQPILSEKTLVVVISQSGETADSLAALREARDLGCHTLAIVNVMGSSIARDADSSFLTLAGPEISVATTKAYSTQLVAMYLLAMALGEAKGTLEPAETEALIAELLTIPEKIEKILSEKERIQWFASKFASARDVFYIGRGVDYASCLEGSLKLKEISYIHSEAYAAGELKHGTISLIEEGILVIGVLTQSALYEKTVSNIVEVKSRGAYVCGLTTYGNYDIEDTADFTVFVPKTDEHFAPSLSVVPLQLMGYYISVMKGLDVDKPRNLAKSVTVE